MSKRLVRRAAGMVLFATLALPTAAANATGPIGSGLWSTSTPGNTGSDLCGPFSPDANGFCTAGAGEPSVELGVKFTSSKAVNIVGVRVYRVDGGAVTGSLWAADGTPLAGAATGAAASFSGSSPHSWQDLAFSPVAITPGQTYIASYLAPTPNYAFTHGFFTNSSYTVGPITALDSEKSGGNGVFCYTGCFPSNTFDDSNYWVTPLWAYNFQGFFEPVDNEPTWNSVKAGSGVPVKFSLGGYEGLDVIKSGNPKATQVACPGSSATVDAIEDTTTANNGLTYDASAGQYNYVWKTNKAWVGKCYQFELGLNDDTSHSFEVVFK